MRRPAAIVVAALVLAGCSYPVEPVIDMAGVDPVKESHDMGDCRQYYETHVGLGDGITGCMRDKGYKILWTSSAF